MPEFDSKILRENYRALPTDLKDAIFSEENSAAIHEIGKKYGFYIDKIGELGNESGRVMLGLTHPKDFIANLAKRLGVDMGKAAEIAKDVNEQIFGPVRESLKKLHKIGEEDENLKSQISNLKSEEIKEEKPKVEEIKPVEEISKSEILISKQIPISNDQITKTEETKLEVAPVEAEPTKPIEEKEILAEGIQRAPKQIREIKDEVQQAKKEAKYPGDVDPYKEPIE